MSAVPSQILYLEHGSSRLYAEAIQIVDNRCLCWARPTLLIQGLPEQCGQYSRQAMISAAVTAPEHSSLQLYDLEGCPDLIWPLDLFQLACDIDFFSLLIRVKMSSSESSQYTDKSHFNAFVSSFWQTHSHSFSTSRVPSLDAR
ncbi:MAG: hypothetical protein HC800_19155 [Phormidesmis sp. RL_2_1]|nr:hypothetical protein [Phormidesmis sp. RL_2_1]